MRLVLDDVHAAYGPAAVLNGVDLEVGSGETIVLVGRNGMGKTSTLRAIMGLAQPAVRKGRVLLDDQPLNGLAPHTIVARGLGYVPQGRRIFPSLTVRENLLLARHEPRNGSSAQPWSLDSVYELYPRLRERPSQRGGTLSGGEQQMLAVGRALMTNPSVLLLDEPSEGLAPKIVRELLDTLVSLRDTGITIVLAEQNLAIAERMGDRIAVMERGRVAVVGAAAAVAADKEVQRRYLGV